MLPSASRTIPLGWLNCAVAKSPLAEPATPVPASGAVCSVGVGSGVGVGVGSGSSPVSFWQAEKVSKPTSPRLKNESPEVFIKVLYMIKEKYNCQRPTCTHLRL